MNRLPNFYWFLAALLTLFLNPTFADEPTGFLAPVRVHSVAELRDLLNEADAKKVNASSANPVMFVLHGNEARSFMRSNYSANQSVVDQSAKLTALGVVQIEVCEKWLGNNGIPVSELQPFVKTVRFAPARISALKDQGYIYF